MRLLFFLKPPHRRLKHQIKLQEMGPSAVGKKERARAVSRLWSHLSYIFVLDNHRRPRKMGFARGERQLLLRLLLLPPHDACIDYAVVLIFCLVSRGSQQAQMATSVGSVCAAEEGTAPGGTRLDDRSLGRELHFDEPHVGCDGAPFSRGSSCDYGFQGAVCGFHG